MPEQLRGDLSGRSHSSMDNENVVSVSNFAVVKKAPINSAFAAVTQAQTTNNT